MTQVTYYRDYLTGAGYLATGVAFKDVGTSLKVRAMVLPGNQVKVRVTPVLSWSADDRPGVIEVAEASTELIVPNGRPVVMGGSATPASRSTGAPSTTRFSYSTPRRERSSLALAQVGQPFLL